MKKLIRQKGGVEAAVAAAGGLGLVGSILILFLVVIAIFAILSSGLIRNPIPTVNPIPSSGVFFIAAVVLGVCVLMFRHTMPASAVSKAVTQIPQVITTGVAAGGALGQRIGALPSFLLFGALLGAAIYGVVKLVQACSGPSPKNGRASYYEGFAAPSEYAKTLRAYIKQVEAAIERVDDTHDHLMNASDDTCDIIRDIEDVYASNSASPRNMDESNLPEDVLKKKLDDRKKRAKKRMLDERRTFTKNVSSEPMLECFEDAGANDEEKDLEDELSAQATVLEKSLGDAEFALATKKSEQIHTALNFAENQLTKNIKRVQSAHTEEGFVQSELIARVDKLLAREKEFSEEVDKVIEHTQKAKAMQKEATKKVNDLEEGNIDESSVAELIPEPKAVQGRCKPGMYEFAAYSGGFCCPEKPTDYNKEHQDYSTCNTSGACALGAETAGGMPVCGA